MTAERIGVAIACVLVAAGIVGAFTVTGSPQHVRAQALDERRVDDLQIVADALQERYAVHARHAAPVLPRQLPRDVRAVRPDGSDATRDPATGRPYRYVRDDARRYRLCATFALADDAAQRYRAKPHPAGPACIRFELTGTQLTDIQATALVSRR